MEEGDKDARQHRTLSVEVDLSDVAPTLANAEPIILDELGYQVDELRFVHTKAFTYVYYTVSIADAETYGRLMDSFLPATETEGLTGRSLAAPQVIVYSADGRPLGSVGYFACTFLDNGVAYGEAIFPAMDPARTSYRIDFGYEGTGWMESRTVELVPR
jgi:hypothetical protein